MDDEKLNNHKFWSKQPVSTPIINSCDINETIDPRSSPIESEKEPISLPNDFEWVNIDLTNKEILKEYYEFLYENYIEDSSSDFRLVYSERLLYWSLVEFNERNDLIRGIRSKITGKLVASIGAMIDELIIRGKRVKATVIDFLCVIRQLRSKRLAPVLIKEITRISHLMGIFHALHTGNIELPTCLCDPIYNHRFLNPEKLLEARFCFLPNGMTPKLFYRLHQTPKELTLKNIRPMCENDIKQTTDLLNNFYKDKQLSKVFTYKFVSLLIPRENLIYSYVVETNGIITDFLSFYSLDASTKLLQNDTIHIAMLYYFAHTSSSLSDLISDFVYFAKKENFDVINALEVLNLNSVFKQLKFVTGTGTLRYYLYNWKCPKFDKDQLGYFII